MTASVYPVATPGLCCTVVDTHVGPKGFVLAPDYRALGFEQAMAIVHALNEQGRGGPAQQEAGDRFKMVGYP